MVMSDRIAEQIRQNFTAKNSDELLQIWKENDRERWSGDAFEAIKQILIERGLTIPAQSPEKPSGVTSPEQRKKSYKRNGRKRKTVRIVVGSILIFFGIVLGSILYGDILEDKHSIIEAIFFPPNLGWLVSLIIGGLWYDRLGKVELRGPLALTIGTVLFFIFLFVLMTAVAAGVVWYHGQEFVSVPAIYFLIAGVLLFLSYILSFSTKSIFNMKG
jgi:hypothetical protein